MTAAITLFSPNWDAFKVAEHSFQEPIPNSSLLLSICPLWIDIKSLLSLNRISKSMRKTVFSHLKFVNKSVSVSISVSVSVRPYTPMARWGLMMKKSVTLRYRYIFLVFKFDFSMNLNTPVSSLCYCFFPHFSLYTITWFLYNHGTFLRVWTLLLAERQLSFLKYN